MLAPPGDRHSKFSRQFTPLLEASFLLHSAKKFLHFNYVDRVELCCDTVDLL